MSNQIVTAAAVAPASAAAASAAMRRACVSSSNCMTCSSRRVLYCFLLVDEGFGGVTRRVSAGSAAGSGDSPGSEVARRFRDCLGIAGAAAEAAEADRL